MLAPLSAAPAPLNPAAFPPPPAPPPPPPPPPWPHRFFILKGTTLTYFKSERDVQFPPRGRIDLAPPGAAVVVLEGLKRGKHFTFNIMDKQVGAGRECW